MQHGGMCGVTLKRFATARRRCSGWCAVYARYPQGLLSVVRFRLDRIYRRALDPVAEYQDPSYVGTELWLVPWLCPLALSPGFEL
jgi:hypothetical protein